jgi:hypothetical protein
LEFSVGTSATSIGSTLVLQKYPHEAAGFMPHMMRTANGLTWIKCDLNKTSISMR